MANPASVVQNTTQAFVSLLNVYEPQYNNKLVMQAPEEFKSISGIMQLFGRMREVAIHEPTYFHFELPRQWLSLGVNANVGAPGAGVSVTWTLPAADHFNAGTLSFPRVNDIVIFNNAGTAVYGKITTVNTTTPGAHTVTAAPRNTADAIPALVGGTRVSWLSNAFGEGTGQPLARTPIVTQFDFTTQILKDTVTTTGSELTNRTYVEVAGMKGYFYVSDEVTRMRFRAMEDVAYLTSPGISALAVTAGFGDDMAQGIIPWAQSGGNIQTYVPGALAMSDLDGMIDLLDADKVGTEFFLWSSLNFHRQFSDIFVGMFQEGGVLFGEFAGKEEIAAKLNITQLKRSGYLFNTMYLPVLSDPNILGNATLPYSNFAIVAPMGSTADALGGGSVPCLELTYKADGRYNRKYKTWETGANASVPTDQNDVLNLNYLAQVGTWPKNAPSFGIFTS